MREQIIGVFTSLKEIKEYGLWFSGIEGEGKRIKWHTTGTIAIIAHFKNNSLHGDYKYYSNRGTLMTHRIYRNGKVVKEDYI
jgi:antitoxin component YwqK of YwqJK toxin-antitoxin module